MRQLNRYILMTILALTVSLCAQDEEESALCSLRVATIPTGAEVKLNDNDSAPSPMLAADIQPGTHIITLKKSGYKTHRRTISLMPGQKIPLEIKLEPITGLLLIHTTPDEVDVTIDDISHGKTPLLVTEIGLGRHKVHLSKNGYLEKTITASIENRTPQKIEETLTPDSGSIVFSSVPEGAEITLNGISYGTTPKTVDQIPRGLTRVAISLEGYKDYTREITLIPGQIAKVSAVMIAIPAEMTIVSIPDNARIYVNNEFKGESPVTLTDLEPGKYRIRAELPGYETNARDVTLENAEKVTEELRLDGNCGQLEVTTEPAGIKVFVDGKEKGVTVSKESETDRVSLPLLIDLIPEGEHEVKLTATQYFPVIFKVNIEAGKTVTVHPRGMKRRFIPNIEIRTRKDVYKGVLIETDPIGNVKLEIRPGILKTVEAGDIISKEPLKAPELDD